MDYLAADCTYLALVYSRAYVQLIVKSGKYMQWNLHAVELCTVTLECIRTCVHSEIVYSGICRGTYVQEKCVQWNLCTGGPIYSGYV